MGAPRTEAIPEPIADAAGAPQGSPPPALTGLAGALRPPAVDALFAGLGSGPLGDPFAGGPF